MQKRTPQAEIADDELDQVTGGTTTAGTAFGAGATSLPSGGGTSAVMKAASDTQSGLAGNLKAS